MSGSSDKEQASVLISFIGMVNTAGIVLVGYVGDLQWVSPPLLYSMAICLSGLSIFLIPVVDSYRGLALLSSLYGLTISANYALVSVILVDLISLDKFTIGYGLLLLVQGIASLIGPPLAGELSINDLLKTIEPFLTDVPLYAPLLSLYFVSSPLSALHSPLSSLLLCRLAVRPDGLILCHLLRDRHLYLHLRCNRSADIVFEWQILLSNATIATLSYNDTNTH